VDFLTDYVVPNDWELNNDLSEEEVFFVDVFSPLEDVLQWHYMI